MKELRVQPRGGVLYQADLPTEPVTSTITRHDASQLAARLLKQEFPDEFSRTRVRQIGESRRIAGPPENRSECTTGYLIDYELLAHGIRVLHDGIRARTMGDRLVALSIRSHALQAVTTTQTRVLTFRQAFATRTTAIKKAAGIQQDEQYHIRDICLCYCSDPKAQHRGGPEPFTLAWRFALKTHGPRGRILGFGYINASTGQFMRIARD